MHRGSTIAISITTMATDICLLYRSKLNQTMNIPKYTKGKKRKAEGCWIGWWRNDRPTKESNHPSRNPFSLLASFFCLRKLSLLCKRLLKGSDFAVYDHAKEKVTHHGCRHRFADDAIPERMIIITAHFQVICKDKHRNDSRYLLLGLLFIIDISDRHW